MKKATLLLLILTMPLAIHFVHAQAQKKKLPRNINMSGYDSFGPAISGDGNSMIFMSNYTNEGGVTVMYTRKESASSWSDPKELPRTINIPHLTYENGYCLNFDGTAFYFTFKKSGGLGGFDIWMSKLENGVWTSAQNMGSPLNSSLNDGSPSISPDGMTMYFMSCETMTNTEASGCKLMMSKRSNVRSSWGKPSELAARINQGNSLAPNILADGETLMYLSDHHGSLQWYVSRLEEGEWKEPQRMDFIQANGQRNISVSAKGRYVFHDVPGERGRVLEQLLIPQEFKPKDVLRIIGTVRSEEGGTMKVYDVNSRERKVFKSLASGDTYDIVLKEGHVYDVSFETRNNQLPVTSKIFDLSEMRFSTREIWDVNPKELRAGDSLELKSLRFDTTSVAIHEQSIYEMRRLVRLLSKAVDSGYEINIYHYPLDTATIVEAPEIVNDESNDDYEGDLANEENEADGSYEADSLEVNVIEATEHVEEDVVTLPSMVENLATVLLQELKDKDITENQCIVKGLTVPLKELEGNEDLANHVKVFLKKRQ